MKIEFTHAAVAASTDRRGERARTLVGKVTTPIEIVELAASDLQIAYTLKGGGPPIYLLDGTLYEKAAFDLAFIERFGASPQLSDATGGSRSAFRPYEDYLMDEIVAALDDVTLPTLYPAPRTAAMKEPRMVNSRGVSDYVDRLGPIARGADEGDVEKWRDTARRFLSNLVLVDGELFARRHVPLLGASHSGLSAADTSAYRRFLDHDEPNWFGALDSTDSDFRTQLQIYRISDVEEATEMARRMALANGSDAFRRTDIFECQIEAPIERDILDLELCRQAKLLMQMVGYAKRGFAKAHDRAALERHLLGDNPLAAYSAATDALMKTLLDHEAGEPDFERLLTEFSELIVHCEAFARTTQIVTTRSKAEKKITQARLLLDRLDAAPISVPKTGAQHPLPG